MRRHRHRDRRRRLHGQGPCGGHVGRRRGLRHRAAAPAGDDLRHHADASAERYRAGLWLCPRDRRLAGCWWPTRRSRRWSSPRPQDTHRDDRRGRLCARASRCSAKSRWAHRWTMPRRWWRRPRPRACVNMIGFNYVRTPATQFARQLIADGAIGEITWFRGEHTEDFLADPALPATWRTTGRANGTHGRSGAAYRSTAALALMGPIAELSARDRDGACDAPRPDGPVAVTNDDQAQIMCRFASGRDGASVRQPHRDGAEDGLCL